MKTIKKIVVAVDFSGYSPQLLEYAAGIAERVSAEIVVLNVISKQLVLSAEKVFNSENWGSFSLKKFLDDEIRRRTRDARELVAESVPDSLTSRIMIRWGVPYEEIIKVADNELADLLVVAPHGKSDRARYRMGTTAEKCFRHSRTSLLRINLRSE